MCRIAKLIMVTSKNNNKYYDMIEEGGIIKVNYGRVGQGSGVSKTYPSSRWDNLLRSKVRKGYKDVTGLRVKTESVDFSTITDTEISSIVNELQSLANKSVTSNYIVSSDEVTQAQIDEAQGILDAITELGSRKRKSSERINENLLSLFQVIPRRMKKVNDHLIEGQGFTDKLNEIITSEQATLDVMKGQVRINTVKKDTTDVDKQDILQAMGIEIEIVNSDDIRLIKKELGGISGKLKRAFKVKNLRSQKAFNKFVSNHLDKTTKLFWHGSRNENWWSILDTGLILRPTNAVITGKMFGYGLYFADKARKSYGYTSCNGSYWARGNASKGFMALYSVHLGNTLVCKTRHSWMGHLTDKELKNHGDYDSLTALGGADLRNNEFIVYNQDQCTVQYLVEVA